MARNTHNGRSLLPAWQRISGSQKFDPRQLTILKELCEWRDRTAEAQACPPFKVMDDKRLAAIAAACPAHPTDLEGLLTDKQRNRFGRDIVAAVRRGQTAAPVSRARRQRPNQSTLERANALSEWRKETAKKLQMESDLVLPKAWMQAIVEQNPRNLEELAVLMPDSPWRLAQFGEGILKAIH